MLIQKALEPWNLVGLRADRSLESLYILCLEYFESGRSELDRLKLILQE